MKKTAIILVITVFTAGICAGKANNKNNHNMTFEKNLKIVNVDYGTCYTIGNYQLCPEKKLIKVLRMFGTATKDAVDFFPDTTLQYERETMIIFAGRAFFDKSDLNIDWQTVQLLSYQDHYSEFTDGKTLYYRIRYGSAHKSGREYDKNTYKPGVEEKPAKINHLEFRELTGYFHIKGNTFCYDSLSFGDEVADDEDFNWKEIWRNFEFKPILEPFDVPNLRTIVSKSGFETDYITDGKQVLYSGGSVSYTKKNGKEYVQVKECIVEGVDFATLRILGKDMLADKNAIYYRTEIIPFDKLNGFRFIIREL
ncbi:MAG: DKNYY domain-containing protein [Bacteroidales bacterium]|nr:DKNYY domain-containing protein [Bacteroidales bacterium]